MDKLRVLVAEDESLVALSIRAQLENLGYNVIGEAKDGVEAITMARELHPDVVLMDVKMPAMNGLEAAHKIMEEAPTAIVMSRQVPTAE